jgi:hypothetical protein
LNEVFIYVKKSSYPHIENTNNEGTMIGCTCVLAPLWLAKKATVTFG